MISGTLNPEVPIVLGRLKDHEVVVRCPWCRNTHRHQPKDGVRMSHCDADSREYYVTFCLTSAGKKHLHADAVSYVYLIFDPATGLVKIGKANDIGRRMEGLRQTPTPLVLLYSIACSSEDEALIVEGEFHGEFERLRAWKCEWFNWSQDIEFTFRRRGGKSHFPAVGENLITRHSRQEPNEAITKLKGRLAGSRRRRAE